MPEYFVSFTDLSATDPEDGLIYMWGRNHWICYLGELSREQLLAVWATGMKRFLLQKYRNEVEETGIYITFEMPSFISRFRIEEATYRRAIMPSDDQLEQWRQNERQKIKERRDNAFAFLAPWTVSLGLALSYGMKQMWDQYEINYSEPNSKLIGITIGDERVLIPKDDLPDITRLLHIPSDSFQSSLTWKQAKNLWIVNVHEYTDPPPLQWILESQSDVTENKVETEGNGAEPCILFNQLILSRNALLSTISRPPVAQPSSSSSITSTPINMLKKTRKEIDPKDEYIGHSRAILWVLEAIKNENRGLENGKQMCPSPVLLTGETGVGKTEIAELIHRSSKRGSKFQRESTVGNRNSDTGILGCKWDGITKNSGLNNTPKNGANGLLKTFEGGTIFIDEIAEAGPDLQDLLLDILDGNSRTPQGISGKPFMPNVRLIFATNRDLKELVKKGKFRHDLYDRVCRHQIYIPPIRERMEDVPWLAQYAIKQMFSATSEAKSTNPHKLSPLFVWGLLHYDWRRGNVREVLDTTKMAAQLAHQENSPGLKISHMDQNIRMIVDAHATATSLNTDNKDEVIQSLVEIATKLTAKRGAQKLVSDWLGHKDGAEVSRAMNSKVGEGDSR